MLDDLALDRKEAGSLIKRQQHAREFATRLGQHLHAPRVHDFGDGFIAGGGCSDGDLGAVEEDHGAGIGKVAAILTLAQTDALDLRAWSAAGNDDDGDDGQGDEQAHPHR